MTDLISRQAAIDELERGKDKKAKGAVGGFYNQIIDNDIEKLRRLPSAKPDVPDTNVGDMISRQAAIKVTWKGTGYTDPLNVMTAIRDRLETLPTVDAVPRGAYDQVRWERDIAIGQLKQLGYELGEKVDTVPVRHGRWETDGMMMDDGEYLMTRCTACGEAYEYGYNMPFCPNCGARMDGSGNEAD